MVIAQGVVEVRDVVKRKNPGGISALGAASSMMSSRSVTLPVLELDRAAAW